MEFLFLHNRSVYVMRIVHFNEAISLGNTALVQQKKTFW
jgi:hypothetical protein